MSVRPHSMTMRARTLNQTTRQTTRKPISKRNTRKVATTKPLEFTALPLDILTCVQQTTPYLLNLYMTCKSYYSMVNYDNYWLDVGTLRIKTVHRIFCLKDDNYNHSTIEKAKRVYNVSDVSQIPSNATHVVFFNTFNGNVDNLPSSITHIVFGRDFNQPVDKLPKNLKHLQFGKEFNHPVDNLPQTITHLTFGTKFNQLVNNLPQTITNLVFGGDFNYTVENLPFSLIDLRFGRNLTTLLITYHKTLLI